MSARRKPAFGAVIYTGITLSLSAYFIFAAVQGDFGLFRRAEIDSEAAQLSAQLKAIEAEVARMENLTTRLSDDYLDIDLLDQQARDVLGMMRSDEIVVR
ncbi:septum formation initiator family protein [Salipiger sp. 1_MG-2023]|uniref:FtsB family cell division protein n=1 Tax=Salipiger sp. 1_MG-2023 TaxID=3062665 RepID=UPI0026E2DFBC|nr:septum formation initiator family protein [Salipiger sp. 1_MG-2023]MDO6587578.1 septum formation initiator family protein [Salipiger sp. 1_MG-2023]